MTIIKKIILMVFTLFIMIEAGSILFVYTGVLPIDLLWSNFLYLLNGWELLISAELTLIISFGLFFSFFSSTSEQSKDALILFSEFGKVNIALDGLKNMLEKLIKHISGIKEVKVKIKNVKLKKNESDTLKISVKLVVSPECNVVDISDKIQTKIRTSLKDIVGISDVDIDVFVVNISNVTIQKSRVV